VPIKRRRIATQVFPRLDVALPFAAVGAPS